MDWRCGFHWGMSLSLWRTSTWPQQRNDVQVYFVELKIQRPNGPTAQRPNGPEALRPSKDPVQRRNMLCSINAFMALKVG